MPVKGKSAQKGLTLTGQSGAGFLNLGCLDEKQNLRNWFRLCCKGNHSYEIIRNTTLFFSKFVLANGSISIHLTK